MENHDRHFGKMLRDVALLAKLEEQSEKNFQVIMNQINARRRRRIFFRAALSCAAVALIAFVLAYSSGTTTVVEDEFDILESPVLITESGEKIALADEFSYKLELGKEKKAVEAPKTAAVTEESHHQADDLSSKTVSKNTVVIPRGFTYDIQFDDGSQAHLNSGSYIEFPKSFENKEVRAVSLTGEGYFKVEKSDKPFIVKVGDLHIMVHGTEFNVNTNKEGRVETLLVSGSVSVKSVGTEEEIMLKPNELLVYDTTTGSSVVKEVLAEDYLAWMKGDFTCSSQPLYDLIDELAAFYGITIAKDQALENQLITISLSRQLGYRQIMEILAQAFGLEFNKLDNQTFVCKQTN